MENFVIAVTALFAFDALCGFLNAAQGDNGIMSPQWVRAASRITSLILALWGAVVLAKAGLL